jgi:surface antigen
MRRSGSSYIGGGSIRQSRPLIQAIAIAGVTFSLGGCAQLGLPMVETDNRPAIDRMATGTTLVSANVNPKATANVDSSDWEAMRRALAAAPADSGGTPIAWSNPDTGSDGTITPAAANPGKGGKLCRMLSATISDNRGVRLYRGEACQLTNGRWQIVRIAADDATLS